MGKYPNWIPFPLPSALQKRSSCSALSSYNKICPPFPLPSCAAVRVSKLFSWAVEPDFGLCPNASLLLLRLYWDFRTRRACISTGNGKSPTPSTAAWVDTLAHWSQFHLSLEICLLLRVGGDLSSDTSHGSERYSQYFLLFLFRCWAGGFPTWNLSILFSFPRRNLVTNFTRRPNYPSRGFHVLNFCFWYCALTSSPDIRPHVQHRGPRFRACSRAWGLREPRCPSSAPTSLSFWEHSWSSLSVCRYLISASRWSLFGEPSTIAANFHMSFCFVSTSLVDT